jgi:hypothetical protein
MTLTRSAVAQLANLSIEDVEEAVTLIPTCVAPPVTPPRSTADSMCIRLAPKDHAQLEDLLSTLSAKRRFQN